MICMVLVLLASRWCFEIVATHGRFFSLACRDSLLFFRGFACFVFLLTFDILYKAIAHIYWYWLSEIETYTILKKLGTPPISTPTPKSHHSAAKTCTRDPITSVLGAVPR